MLMYMLGLPPSEERAGRVDGGESCKEGLGDEEGVGEGKLIKLEKIN